MAKKVALKNEVIGITVVDILGNQNTKQVGLMQVFGRLKMIPDTSDQYKFSYWVNKNMERLTSVYKKVEADFMEESKKINQERNKEYNEKQFELKNLYAAKDDKGEMIITDGHITIINEEEFKAKLVELEEEYKDVKEQVEEFNKYAVEKEREMLEVEPYKFDREQLPKGLTPMELEMLEKFFI